MRSKLRAATAVGFILGLASGVLAAAPMNQPPTHDIWTMATSSAGGDIYAATSRLPLVEINDCTGACNSLDGCDLAGGECYDWCDCWCGPRWTVSVGAIFLHRSRPDPAAIITPPTGTPGVVVSAGDFGFGTDVGPDVSFQLRTDSGLIWEGRYFNDRDANATFNIPSITTFRVAGIGVTILGGGSINSSYLTQLDSSELNVHKPFGDRVTFLAGFRWVELHDALRSNLATPVTFVNWDDNNHMYGGQVGTNIAFTDPSSVLRLNCSLKAGVYYNDADNRFTSTIVGGANSSDNATAFVGEVNFTGLYQLTEHIALQGGYQVLWLDNVALAGDAAASTTQIAGGTSSPTITDGRVWYNGATAGLVFTW